MLNSKLIKKSANFERSSRVASEIKAILSEIFLRSEIKDKALFDVVIIVTEVIVSKDLSRAKVFISPDANRDDKAIIVALNFHTYFFKKKVGKLLKIRTVPNFSFVLDDQFDKLDEVNRMFASIFSSDDDKS